MPIVRTQSEADPYTTAIRLPAGTAVPAVIPHGSEGAASHPSDLLAAAVLSSMLSAVIHEAARHGLQPGLLSGEAEAQAAESAARLDAVRILLHFSGHHLDDSGKLLLEQAAMRSLVARSLHPEVVVSVRFRYERES